jgi:hypothetical protein
MNERIAAGERLVGSLSVFPALEVREADDNERKQLQEARNAQKLVAKRRHAARQAAKAA